jgi:hypothetical protein
MTAKEVTAIKARIEQTLSKRNGIGSVSSYTGEKYALPEIKDGEPFTAEIGEKTIDLLLRITGNEPDREFFPELGNGTYQGGAIPEAFNLEDINRICDVLDSDVDAPNRGAFRGFYNGEYYNVPGGFDNVADENNQTETTHCGGSCTGLCVGSCVNMCNGCTGCAGTCVSECGSNSSTNKAES